VAATSDQSTALCFADSSSSLNLALWDAEASDSLYLTTMSGSTNLLFKGCAAVSVKGSWEDRQTLTAIVYTVDHLLAWLTVDLTSINKTSLSTSATQTLTISYTLSN